MVTFRASVSVASATLFCCLCSITAARATTAQEHTTTTAASAEKAQGEGGDKSTPPDPLQLRERVTVTATRIEESADVVGSSVSVITAEQIRATGAHWLSDVLARVPGVTLARTGGPGAVTSVFLRGTNSNQTLVLINGLKANSPSTGAYDLAQIPASQIQRVEIIRGPQSTLYGSDAIGGVINIITRGPSATPSLDAQVQAGSFGTVRASAGTSGRSGRFRYRAGIDYFNSDNISAAAAEAGNRETDRFRNTALDARLGYRTQGGLDLESFADYFNGRVHFDGFDFFTGPIDDPNAVQDERQLLVGTRARYGVGLWDGALTVSVTDDKLQVSDPNGFTTQSTLDTSIAEIDAQNTLRFDAHNTTVAGLEYRHERVTSFSSNAFGRSGFDESIDTLGLYAQHRFSWRDKLHLSAGGRYEHHSRFGDRATYRVTAAYVHPAGLRVHASLATGFRAPSFNELYFPGFGNPSLGPETSRGWDVGAGGTALNGRLDLDFTWFRNDVDNLVQFGFVPQMFRFGFVNFGHIVSQGAEVRAGLLVQPDLRVDLAYTFTDAQQQGSDSQLLRRPRHQGSVTLRYRPRQDLDLFSEVRFKGKRNDFGTSSSVVLPGYVVWNTAAQWQLSQAVQLVGRLDNLTDVRYQEVWGFGAPGRSVYFGVRTALSLR